MSDLPSVSRRIQQEETDFRSPVSESTFQKVGSTMNFILDHYVLPVSSIMDFAGTEDQIPSGWFPCDGREVDRTTYANLFTAIGTKWGVGNGLTTFNVPDLRGIFTRMVDTTTSGSASRDPDEASRTPVGTGLAAEVGSYQTDNFKSHTHNWFIQGGAGGDSYADTNSGGAQSNATTATGGAETRPKNAYVYKIIKS